MDPKVARCTFIGWEMTTKGYCYYDPLTKKTFITRCVKIDESEIQTVEAIIGENHVTFTSMKCMFFSYYLY
jgi:hypothetical protein